MLENSIIISIITTIVTLVLTLLVKKHFDKRYHIFKIKSDHNYAERKKVKEALSTNKVHLINACESLNHRFYNFNSNHGKEWHFMSGVFDKPSKYYFNSFVYRVAILYTWVEKIETDLILMDTTIASKEDLDFVKFLRLFKQVLCDATLIKYKEGYDSSKETDHFFTGTINSIANALVKQDGNIMRFDEYNEGLKPLSTKLEPICKFLDSVSPDESRHRWDRLRLLHLSLLCFLNRNEKTRERSFTAIAEKFTK